jgi:hypothetical protein
VVATVAATADVIAKFSSESDSEPGRAKSYYSVRAC